MELRRAYAQSQARVRELEAQLHTKEHNDIHNSIYQNNDRMWTKLHDLERRFDDLERRFNDLVNSNKEESVSEDFDVTDCSVQRNF